jgi:site-specific recombinase XerD
MQSQITFLQALEGYLLYADARRLSPHTIADYSNTFRKFQIFLDDDPLITAITPDQVRAFFISCDGLSKKTLRNYHIGLSALWTWALDEGLVQQHIIKRVARPVAEKPAIKPYTREDVEAMLAASPPDDMSCQTKTYVIVAAPPPTVIRPSSLSWLTPVSAPANSAKSPSLMWTNATNASSFGAKELRNAPFT